jgi:16S rRNA processing protein RimM
MGVVSRAHGIHGEIRVRLHWAESASLELVTRIRLSKPEWDVEYKVAAWRRADRDLLVTLNGVSDRTQAEPLKGARVHVYREDLPALPEGEYYLIDLVGCKVMGPSGTLGTVESVRAHPTLDSIVILAEDGSELEQPLIPHWIENVDLERRIIALSSEDGLVR